MCITKFPWQEQVTQAEAIILHSQRLLHSFNYWTGKSLLHELDEPEIAEAKPLAIAKALYASNFILVSHGMESDPILNYGNQAALQLWQMEWAKFTSTPSRLTAEVPARAERDRLLAEVETKGFISKYQGVRVSSTGQRFSIDQAIIWNVLDENKQKCGQAATFKDWQLC